MATALEVQWLPPFTLPLRPPSAGAPKATPARTAILENLTIRFGAHRVSLRGSSAASKTAAFAAAAKDHVRESLANDFIHKTVQSNNLYEEFPDYHKLLHDMAVDPTSVTCYLTPIPCSCPRLLASKTIPSYSIR